MCCVQLQCRFRHVRASRQADPGDKPFVATRSTVTLKIQVVSPEPQMSAIITIALIRRHSNQASAKHKWHASTRAAAVKLELEVVEAKGSSWRACLALWPHRAEPW